MTGKENIIFSADDFGKSPKANKNILDLLTRNKINRISVFVNSEFSLPDIEKISRSKAKIDIHLELPRDHLVKKGFFVRLLFFVSRIISGKTSAKKVEKCWEEQIENFKKIFGKYPDGLNSHEHIHFFPPYFKIALKLCEKYRIKHIRFAKKDVIANYSTIGWIIKILNRIDRRRVSCFKFHVLCSMNLVSLDWISNFEKFLKHLPAGATEIVCHPEREEEYNFIREH